jgi:hypothetical protein
MSKLEAIEAEVRKLPLDQAAELQDWLADYLEDLAELNPKFTASIERGNADLHEGRVRSFAVKVIGAAGEAKPIQFSGSAVTTQL